MTVGLGTAALFGTPAAPIGTIAAFVLALALVAVPATVGATTVLAVPFAEQCSGAESIVVGTVREVTSRRSPLTPSSFETLVTLAIDEVVAGNAPPRLTLRLAGGEIGAVRQSIDGMPEFAVGERYVVFLDRDHEPPLISPITGFNQGLYRIERADDGDVVRDRAGRVLSAEAVAALGAGGAERRASAVAPSGSIGTSAAPSLEAFVSAIRAARPR